MAKERLNWEAGRQFLKQKGEEEALGSVNGLQASMIFFHNILNNNT